MHIHEKNSLAWRDNKTKMIYVRLCAVVESYAVQHKKDDFQLQYQLSLKAVIKTYMSFDWDFFYIYRLSPDFPVSFKNLDVSFVILGQRLKSFDPSVVYKASSLYKLQYRPILIGLETLLVGPYDTGPVVPDYRDPLEVQQSLVISMLFNQGSLYTIAMVFIRQERPLIVSSYA